MLVGLYWSSETPRNGAIEPPMKIAALGRTDGAGFDDERAYGDTYEDAVGTCHHGRHLIWPGHARDHHLRLARQSGRVVGPSGAGVNCRVARLLVDVVNKKRVTGRDQVLHHRHAHAPEADETYVHATISLAGRFRRCRVTPTRQPRPDAPPLAGGSAACG